MRPSISIFCLTLIALLTFLLPSTIQLGYAQKPYTVEQIPDPKKNGGGYVSNPDKILDASEEATINQIISDLETKTGVQIAVVVIRDFENNTDDFDFALDIFRKWGIGKAGADNGLLLLVAIDRRAYRFITGYGLEGTLPDVKLRQIGDRLLVPAFREAAYGAGIESALREISTELGETPLTENAQRTSFTNTVKENTWAFPVLTTILIFIGGIFAGKHLKRYRPSSEPKKTKNKKIKKINNGYDKVMTIGCMGVLGPIFFLTILLTVFTGFGWLSIFSLSSIPYIMYTLTVIGFFFAYYEAMSALRRHHKDDGNFVNAVAQFHKRAWLYVLLSPLVLIGFVLESRRRKTINKRFEEPVLDSHGQQMMRLDRDENPTGSPYISEGQLAEENAGAMIYDIWLSSDGKEHQNKAHESFNYHKFDACPKCQFRTLSKPQTITITRATYSKSGSGKKVLLCGHCKYEDLIRMVVLPKLTKSSSSSSSGSGSSSSSSSSSSWGGGSSGGGGAGGRW